MQRKERIKTKKTALYRKAKRSGGGERGGVRLLPGIIAAGTAFMILITVSSYLMKQSLVPVSLAPLLGKLSFALASGIGCWTAARSADRRKLLAAAITGLFLLAAAAAGFALRKEPGPARLAAPLAITSGTILLGTLLGTRKRGLGYR